MGRQPQTFWIFLISFGCLASDLSVLSFADETGLGMQQVADFRWKLRWLIFAKIRCFLKIVRMMHNVLGLLFAMDLVVGLTQLVL